MKQLLIACIPQEFRPHIKRVISYYRSNGFVQTAKKIIIKIRQNSFFRFHVNNRRNDAFSYIREAIDEKHQEYKSYIEYDSCESAIKYIAFYLPQFHPIPENNLWWGDGFTEWSNVTRALPQYVGHHQPKLPGELGFYDLRLREVRLRQIELARNYGLHGFCYHYYWFSGKKLLDYPINEVLKDKGSDFPFCINWANENWTRRWDGKEADILLEQSYSSEDYLEFIKDVSVFLQDERYIRVGGKPLLLVYRPSLIPDVDHMVEIWRNYCRDIGIGEIYLVLTHSFDTTDPETIGFDAAVDFAPNNMTLKSVSRKIEFINNKFSGNIYDYKSAIEQAKKYSAPVYTKFRSICPSWDNEARKTGRGTILDGASPSLYKEWLKLINEQTIENNNVDNRFVFINAWNEWAEGACLEPDKRFGYAYLDATRNALKNTSRMVVGRRIVLVAHDAHPHGAQYLILNMAKVLQEDMGFIVDMIVLGEGVLMDEYQKYANVYELAGCDLQSEEIASLVSNLFKQGTKSAIVNTTVSGLMVPVLKKCGFTVVSLIHELPQLIKDYGLQEHVNTIAEGADKIVFAASPVLDGFESFVALDREKIVLKPQGLYKKNSLQSSEQIQNSRIELRQRFNLPEDSKVILGVGYADYRKGIDIFVEAGLDVLKQHRDVYFIWLGKFEPLIEKEVRHTIEQSDHENHFIFPGLDYDSDIYYAGADIYALTSREDPFPSVVMEAMDALTPVVSFTKSGGAPELLSKVGGVLVDDINSEAFSLGLKSLMDSPEKINQLALKGKNIVDEEFSFRKYIFDLVVLAQTGIQRVSVIVPSYNYESYIKQRLQTIINQEYPIYEIIVLDDASTDKSVDIIRGVLETQSIDYKVIVNKNNSGTVFGQWKKGVDIAKGNYVWIAEADDFSNRKFLCEVMQGFESPGVVLSYCESNQVNEAGEKIAENYLYYVADISVERWSFPYIKHGYEEVTEALSIKNTVPNVSGVVFEAANLKSVLENHFDMIRTYRVAGDWLVYVLLLKRGKIAFSPEALNMHRRHQKGVTIGGFDVNQLDEIMRMQAYVADEFEVPHEKALIAKKYIDDLSAQFGLVSK